MKRQVVLYLGMSLDGYLADLHGGVDWMVGENPEYLGDLGYAQFLQQVDTILMGGTTYHQVTEELSPGIQGSTAMYSPIGRLSTRRESPSTVGMQGKWCGSCLPGRAKTSGSAAART